MSQDDINKPKKVKKPLNSKQKALYAVLFVLLFVAIVWTVYIVVDIQSHKTIVITAPEGFDFNQYTNQEGGEPIKIQVGEGENAP